MKLPIAARCGVSFAPLDELFAAIEICATRIKSHNAGSAYFMLALHVKEKQSKKSNAFHRRSLNSGPYLPPVKLMQPGAVARLKMNHDPTKYQDGHETLVGY